MDIHLEKFHQICEAYEVLINPQWKQIYDIYGEQALREGLPDQDGICHGGYVYQQNCYEIFDTYFLRNNPFFDICDDKGIEVEGSLFGRAFGGMNQLKLPPMPTVEIKVPVTLKEFYNGCVKTVNFEKQVLCLDGKSVVRQNFNKQIVIKPGMEQEQTLSFKGEGHQIPGQPASNLFISFVEVPPHPSTEDFNVTSCYRRNKNDLFFRKEISLQEAINCRPVKIPLLNGRKILLAIDQVITPKTIKKIAGEGMQVYNPKEYDDDQKQARGDLYVSFEIKFPKNLT